MTNQLNLKCLEIYITNECNLTCSNCNRFNNYDFKGHLDWQVNKNSIHSWAKRIQASSITIIGGEPSIHPDLKSWVYGIAEAWPNLPISIQTNGVKNIAKFEWWDRAVWQYPNLGLTVAIHSQNFKSKFEQNYRVEQTFDAMMFSDCALLPDDRSAGFSVHQSEPKAAWGACTMKYSHTILNGLLYRCPMVAILPQFRKQYRVAMTPSQEKILSDYKSLSSDCSEQDLIDFINASEYEMKQCSLCPPKYIENLIRFDSNRKKYPRLN